MIPILDSSIPGGTTLTSLLIAVVVIIILWIIVSIPVYIAGKIVAGRKATLGRAMAATLLGPLIYLIVLIGVDFFLGEVVGRSAFIWGYLLAFAAWIWVYKSTFRTSWLRGLAIALLAIVIFVILGAIIGLIIGTSTPGQFFPAV